MPLIEIDGYSFIIPEGEDIGSLTLRYETQFQNQFPSFIAWLLATYSRDLDGVEIPPVSSNTGGGSSTSGGGRDGTTGGINTYNGPRGSTSANNVPNSSVVGPIYTNLGPEANQLTIRGYRDLLWAIQFWKQSIIVEYRDVEFKFLNTGLGNNGSAKLQISGIVPDLSDPISGRGPSVGSKEYVIYTELRGINLERWNVRVPWIFDTSAKYNVLEGNPNIPYFFNLKGGIGYDFSNEFAQGPFSQTGYVPLFDRVVSTDTGDGSGTRLQFTFSGQRTFINTSFLLREDLPRLYDVYGEHPMLVFYNANTSANTTNTKFYQVLPIGIEKYKVTLSLANGENVTRFFDVYWNPISI